MWLRAGLAAVLCAVLAACGPNSSTGLPSMGGGAAGGGLPRTALFSDPERKAPKLSPAGDWIAYLAKTGEGYDLIAASVADMADMRKLASGVTAYEWAPGGTAVIYWAGGLVYADDVATTEVTAPVDGSPPPPPPVDRLLIDQPGGKYLGASARRPGKVVFQIAGDVFEIDVGSGARSRIYQDRANYDRLLIDADNRVRVGMRRLANGDWEFFALERTPRKLLTITRADTLYFTVRNFAPDGKSFFLLAPLGLEQAALIRVDMETGTPTVAAADDKADVVDVWMNAAGEPVAYTSEYLRRVITPMTDAAGAEIEFLKQKFQGDIRVVSRNAGDTKWIVEEESPAIPPRAWLYDRTAKTVEKVLDQYPSLADRTYAPTAPVEIAARDGLILPGLLTPPARGEGPAPLVLIAADEPWMRNHFGFLAAHQLFADLGYAVLSVNQRGAEGFGAAYAKAGKGAFGEKMQTDLLDAAHWAIAQKIARPGKIAILGSSLGGYATAAALAFTPREMACGVAMDAPLDLRNAPVAEMSLRIADPATAEGGERLKALSPWFAADKIEKPLLLVRRDWRLPRAGTDELVSAMAANKRPIAYAQFSSEAEDFAAAPDRIAFYTLASAFLSKCLGGRADPIGADFRDSSLQILAGEDLIPSLDTAMAPRDGDLGAPP